MTDDGIYPDIPEHIYHAARDSLSQSGAKLLLPPSAPAKFREVMDSPQPPRKVFDFGTLAHGLILGKGVPLMILYPEIHGVKKDGAVADNPTATASWKAAESEARAAGKLPVHSDDYLRADEMSAAIQRHPVAGPLFTDGTAELSMYAADPQTGVRLRGRADWTTEINGRPIIVDYKTAATANPAEFERASAKWMYHLQAAWYLDLAAALGINNPRFLMVAQEKAPPYLVSVVELDDEAIAEGRRLKRRAIDTYAQCQEAGVWPGYPAEIHPISLPMWAFDEQEMEIA